MPHLFISYSKKDARKLALELADALNNISGITAWVDRSLRAGKSWELQIQSQIDRCDAMIVLYSPDINRHKSGHPESYVLTEIAYAKYTAGKRIIPVMAQTTAPPMSLTLEHYIDFTLDGLTLHNLVDALCDELDIKPLVSASAPPIEASPAPTTPSDTIREWRLKRRQRLARATSADDTAYSQWMPAPFAWMKIPHQAYRMAKYPVTYAQYAKFIEAGGYDNQRWWSSRGWQLRQEGKLNQSRYWQDYAQKVPARPVTAVSWHEAMAFCLWLSDVSGENILLPTEEQWQYVAQGDDGRKYPWGNTWHDEFCNHSVGNRGIGRPTPVTMYEGKGDSPFGVVDMAGNVLEWCLTEYETRKNKVNSHSYYHALRGGSWKHTLADNFLCVSRYREFSDTNYHSEIGFRIVWLDVSPGA